ncbi:choline transporter-like protein 4 [Protobothrops mucrosquamatus]|uniref:choline transporter-like protein 4 n=1 Tax=Protobothrops mucrosquamatus TaxID=103944 RepID=UPI000775F0D8|nr:choline transporter-like protein 4 [Protobothrops mucrosquamatus]
MGGKKKEDNEASSQYGEKCQYDASFHGPIQNRSCTDIICCVIFGVFLAGYMVIGLLAWLYGDPRQVIYPRNSTGSYCGIGGNRGKPYLLYFNLMKCVVETNPLAIAMKGLQCPTPQICVANCSREFWPVSPTAFHKKPSDVWNQTMCQPSIDLETTTLTVSQILNQQLCPQFTIPTEPVLNRCLPFFNISEIGSFNVGTMTVNETMKNITVGTEQLLNSLNVKDIGVKIFEDFTRTWFWILIGLLLAMILSLLFLLLLRYIAGILVWVLIVGVVAIIAYGIYHCYTEYDILKNKGATIQTIGFTTNLSAYGSVKETWLAALIVLCVAEGILLLSLLFLRNRIFIAIALIKEASRAIGHMMSTLVYPLLTFVLIVICVAYWGMTALYLSTSGEPLFRVTPTNDTAPGCEKFRGNESCKPLDFNASANLPCITECIFYRYNDEGLYQRNLFNLQIYNVVGFLWCINFVIALGQCVLAGAFASYYWAFNKPQDIPACALPSAFLRTLRYHIGSLAFGSLILTIVQLIRMILEYLDHKLKEAENPVANFLMCCLKCCFWCLEKFIKFLNRNAYIMIAIYGKNFCVSAKNAFNLLMRNVVRVVVLDKVTDLLLFFGKLLVVGGIGVLSFFFFTGRIPTEDTRFKSPVLNYYWLPILTVVVGSYLIAQGFFSVYNMCVDTLFLCFLEDLERNDGSQEKPYYMSKSLMKILNKKNKKPKDK